MQSFRKISILFFLLIFTRSASASTDNVLNLVTFDYPPLFHKAINKEFSGTVGETVKYICSEAKIQCNVKVVPFKRAYIMLDNNLVDGIITISAKRFSQDCIASEWKSPWAAGFFTHLPTNQTPKTANEVLGHDLIVVAGMQSPFAFMPDLNQWHKEKKINVFHAHDARDATLMFTQKRAPLLWGSIDFEWYFKRADYQEPLNFIPLLESPIVLWVKKNKQDILAKFNEAYHKVEARKELNDDGILKADILSQYYIDAPFYSYD